MQENGMRREQIQSYEIGDMKLVYLREWDSGDKETVGMLLFPGELEAQILWEKEYRLEPLVQVKLAQDAYPFGFSQGRTMRNSASVLDLYLVRQWVEPDERWTNPGFTVITELADSRGYRYFHHVSGRPDSPSIECFVRMVNQSQEPVTVEMLTSFTLGGLTPFTDGLAEETMVLHQLRSTWSAEGRLVSHPLEELQLEPSWQKYSANTIRFGQLGSMPVRQYAPFAAVEDVREGVVWAVQLTHASSWQIEAYRRDDCLALSGGLADREFGHWTKVLQPEGAFETPRAVLTVTRGDANHAAWRLTENMRDYLELPESERDLPIIFNEFCTTWGCPGEEQIIRMAHLLKGKGIRYFVIDAGWFDSEAFDVRVDIGRWEYNPDRFPHGMDYVADMIRGCGMVPGIWFEFEISGADSATFQWVDHLLKRDGIPITSGKRRFFDMRQPWVQEYLAEKVIRFIKEHGFGYLKVDYNETLGMGCDGADSLGEGLRQQIAGTQQFFRRIHRELPELVIENCSSGGHRLVPSFLEITSMSSFSDAHECDEIPIIAANMHRMILPRQSQIWAVLKGENPSKKFYYQMASTFLGRCCISGEIELLSRKQWEIVEEGFRFYKKAAPVIDRGESFYLGTPIASYRKPKGWQGILRLGETGALLVVHTFLNSPSQITVPVGNENWRIAQVFARPGVETSLDGGKEPGQIQIRGLEEFDGAGILLERFDRAGNLPESS